MRKFYSDVAEQVRTTQKDGIWTSRHGYTNFRVTFPEKDRATVRFLFVNFSGSGEPPILNGSTPSVVSDARMECRRDPNGEWRIYEFVGTPVFFGNDPHLNKIVRGTG